MRSMMRRVHHCELSRVYRRWKYDQRTDFYPHSGGCKRNKNRTNLLKQIRTSMKPFDARVHFLRAFASADDRPAMREAVLGRVEWSHGESNPDLLNAIQPSSR